MRIEKIIMKVGKLIKSKINEELLSEDITGKQYFILETIKELGEISPAKLADILDRDRSTVADIVRRLISKGFLEKMKNPNDGRSYIVKLSEKAIITNDKFKKKKELGVDKALSNLNEKEKELLRSLLGKIITGGGDFEGDK